MNIYQAVKKISTDLLYLKPAIPLGHLCSTETTSSSFHSYVTAIMSFLPTEKYMPWFPWLHQLMMVCDATMETQQC
jgi:hypothetical protein